jgi:hypothetical protein
VDELPTDAKVTIHCAGISPSDAVPNRTDATELFNIEVDPRRLIGGSIRGYPVEAPQLANKRLMQQCDNQPEDTSEQQFPHGIPPCPLPKPYHP